MQNERAPSNPAGVMSGAPIPRAINRLQGNVDGEGLGVGGIGGGERKFTPVRLLLSLFPYMLRKPLGRTTRAAILLPRKPCYEQWHFDVMLHELGRD
jgi:hypothetical protein